MTTEGQPLLVGLEAASRATDAWAGSSTGSSPAGLRAPLLVVSDGAPGLIAAVELVFPHSLRQRCLIHRARNVLAKVPAEPRARSRPRTGRSSTTPAPRPQRTPSPWPSAGPTFAVAYAKRFPAAVACLMTTSPASPPTCGSRPATTAGSATPTSSNAPSARPAGGSRSSDGSPANAPAWAGVGGPRPGQSRLAGCRHDTRRRSPTPRPTPPTPPPTCNRGGGRRGCHPRRIGSAIGSPRPDFSTISGTPPRHTRSSAVSNGRSPEPVSCATRDARLPNIASHAGCGFDSGHPLHTQRARAEAQESRCGCLPFVVRRSRVRYWAKVEPLGDCEHASSKVRLGCSGRPFPRGS